MGCDIHPNYEIRIAGVWTRHDWEEQFIVIREGETKGKMNWGAARDHPLSLGRNYDLFAVLASVRNGRGFAGIKTSGGFNPISQPRNLPDDVSVEVLAFSEEYGINGHSHSWLSLPEMLDYDYKQTVTQYGVVELDQYKIFKEKGKPETRVGGVWGTDVRHVENDTMDDLLDPRDTDLLEPGITYVTRIQWEESYRDAIGPFWFTALDHMATLAEDPENVRLVFWFDN